jgi:uncharacterized protein (TIGR03435 family)
MRRFLCRGCSLLIALIVGPPAVRLLGQAEPEQKPQFEVASIKPNSGGPESGMTRFSGGRYITRYATLRELIGHAYGVGGRSLSDRQLIGAPAWLSVDRFDIEAAVPGIPDDSRGIIPAAVGLRIRSLLEERCMLVTHYEQRELPLYALVLLRRDGSLGPRLRRRTTPCVPTEMQNGLPVRRTERCGGRAQPGLLQGNGGTSDNIAYGIAQFVPDVDRIVVNRTGLVGFFDFELSWTPNLPLGETTRGDSPSLFTALEEQLGLKLEPIKGAVDVLVIDHVEKPTPN